MASRNTAIPFSFTHAEDWGGDIFYYSARFTKDFGVIKKGEKFPSVAVNYESGSMKCWADEDQKELTHQIKFICHPK